MTKDNGHRYSISINVLDSLAKELSCGAVTILDDKTIKQRLKNLSESLKMANLRVSECVARLLGKWNGKGGYKKTSLYLRRRREANAKH